MTTLVRLIFCFLALACFSPKALNAQCGNYGSYDNPTCNEINRTYGSVFSCPSGHCRWDFSYPANFTMVSRTANTITLYNGRITPSYSSVFVTMYDSTNNCTATMDWTDRYMQQTFPDIVGTIPVCPVPAQVYVYTANRYPTHPSAPAQESITWSIVGGAIQSTSNSALLAVPVYDTVRVLWNAAGPHRLIATRVSNGTTAWGPQTCTNRDTIWDGIGLPVISGAAALCGTTTGNYSIPALDPAFTYTWSCSNGSITAGQGTANVTVNWIGSGVLTLTRTSLACGWSDAVTKNVTISASGAPVPVLPPTATACTGQSVALYPGAFTTYRWSNLNTTSAIAPTTSGTYTVTVTNAAGCQASASSVVTISGAAPVPNLGPNQTVCTGTPVTLNPGTFSSYLWSTGATTQTISPTTSGTYSVTVTNAAGCSAMDAMVLTVNPAPAPAPNLGPNQAVCVGTPVTLNPGTFSSYNWSTGATTQTISPTTSGTYSVTVTNASGCTGNDVMVLTVNPNPSFSLGNDTLICADTTIVIDGPIGPYNYIWSTGALGASTTISTGGTYQLTVTDANGCTASDAIVITGMSDCVFPGDANYDGVANNQDILSIGAYYGTAGPVRPGASTQWYGQSLPNWGGALPLQADPKHSDCNGDGLVQAADTLAVTLNYLQTHNKAGSTASGNNLSVVPLNDSMSPGDTAWFAVQLGDAALLADSVYGLAFTINHSTGGVLAPGLIQVVYANCWFAPAGQRLDFTRNMAPAPSVDVAISRTDQQNQQGFGEVCRVAILTDPIPAAAQMPLEVWITGANLVEAGLLPQAVLPVPGTTVISTTLTGIAEKPQPRIFPNPANHLVRVEHAGVVLERVEVLDAQGKLVSTFLGDGGSLLEIPTEALGTGIYLLRVHAGGSAWAKVLLISR